VTDPQPLAALPALLCTAVEDVTGHPCRRIGCDGIHAWDGSNPWQPPHRAGVDAAPPAPTETEESA
jgi:hypothetical protein